MERVNVCIRWRRFILSWAMLMAMALSALAQTKTEADSIRTRLVLGARAHYGFVLIHSYALDPVRHTFPWGTEVDLGKQLLSKRAWDFCNCYPRVGAALTFWNYGSEILGYGATAMWYVEPVYLTRHRLNLGFRLGAGISYQTHPYDALHNPNNLAYSLRVNVPIAVGLGLSFRLDPQWSLRLAGNFNHVSNGGLALPNKGINYPTLSVGADYAPQGVDFVARAKNRDMAVPQPRLRFYAGVAGTLKRAGAADALGTARPRLRLGPWQRIFHSQDQGADPQGGDAAIGGVGGNCGGTCGPRSS